jgi:hypothetical protein
MPPRKKTKPEPEPQEEPLKELQEVSITTEISQRQKVIFALCDKILFDISIFNQIGSEVDSYF